jgi:hypothetical protein
MLKIEKDIHLNSTEGNYRLFLEISSFSLSVFAKLYMMNPTCFCSKNKSLRLLRHLTQELGM